MTAVDRACPRQAPTMGPVRIALLFALGTVSAPVAAHPHVFVEGAAGFRFDEAGRLTALRITWTYDAFAMLVMFNQLGLDPDGDGALDDADRARIVRGETDWPEDYDGDVHLDADGTRMPLGRPEGAEAWIESDRISVAFDLPLAVPLPDPDGARLRLYDPSYFYAYALGRLEDIHDAPCTARIQPHVPDMNSDALRLTLAQLSREQTPEQPDVGASFSDAAILACD